MRFGVLLVKSTTTLPMYPTASPILDPVVPRTPEVLKWWWILKSLGYCQRSAQGKGAFSPLLWGDYSRQHWVSSALCLCLKGRRVEEAHFGPPSSEVGSGFNSKVCCSSILLLGLFLPSLHLLLPEKPYCWLAPDERQLVFHGAEAQSQHVLLLQCYGLETSLPASDEEMEVAILIHSG